jgi:hypothetical protein
MKIHKHIALSVGPEASEAWQAMAEFVAAYRELQGAVNGDRAPARHQAELATKLLVTTYEIAVQAHEDASERGKFLGPEGEERLAEFMADGELNVMRES